MTPPAPVPAFDVIALGSAIVDLLVPVAPEAVAQAGLTPGTMTLIDAEEADRLWGHLGPELATAAVVAGGSGANTAVGVAALGGRAALVGRVGEDPLGRAYTEDLARAGVSFLPGGPEGPGGGTARCYILVTPDGERTMRTYLGVAGALDPAPLDQVEQGGSRWLYLEGYLWDAPEAGPILARALELTGPGGPGLSISLSDPGCVERHSKEFRALVEEGRVDLLFGNEAEILALWETGDWGEAVEATRRHCPWAALTRGPAGSVVLAGPATVEIPAAPTAVVDTTGAGDLYAAGFLYGRCLGLDASGCGRLAALAAADVIAALGARPHRDLRVAARAEGLL